MDPGPGGQKRQKKRLRPNNRPTVGTHTPPMPAAPHPGLEPPNVSSCMSACRWFLGSWKRLGGVGGLAARLAAVRCGMTRLTNMYIHTYVCMYAGVWIVLFVCTYIHLICTILARVSAPFHTLHRLLQRYDKMSNICNLI